MRQRQLHEPQSRSTERLSDEEVRAVVALWSEERHGSPQENELPTAADVAEGLDIPVEEAYRLLQEVRARRANEQNRLRAAEEVLEDGPLTVAERERRLAELQRQRGEMERRRAEEARIFAEFRREQAEGRSRLHESPESSGGDIWLIVESGPLR